MKDILNNKKTKLQASLKAQVISEADIIEAQRRADEVLNKYLTEKEVQYEQEKMKINAQLELIEELLNY